MFTVWAYRYLFGVLNNMEILTFMIKLCYFCCVMMNIKYVVTLIEDSPKQKIKRYFVDQSWKCSQFSLLSNREGCSELISASMCLFNVEDPEGSLMHIWAHCDITAGMQCCTALVWHPFPLGILPSLPPPVSLLVPAAPGLSLLPSSGPRRVIWHQNILIQKDSI